LVLDLLAKAVLPGIRVQFLSLNGLMLLTDFIVRNLLDSVPGMGEQTRGEVKEGKEKGTGALRRAGAGDGLACQETAVGEGAACTGAQRTSTQGAEAQGVGIEGEGTEDAGAQCGCILGGDSVHLSGDGWRFCSKVHKLWAKSRSVLDEWVHAPLRPWVHLVNSSRMAGIDTSRPIGEADSEAKAALARTELAEKVQLMGEAGLPVPESMLEWLYPGSPLLRPRKGYRPPDATLELRIPLAVFLSMHPEVPVTQETFPDLFDTVTAVTVRSRGVGLEETVRRRIQVSVQALQGQPPARQHQSSLGVNVTFLTGLPEERNLETGEPAPLATRTKFAMRGPKRTRRKLVNASYSKQQLYKLFSWIKWDAITGNRAPYFSGNVLRLDFQIWFEDSDPRDGLLLR